MSSRRCSFVIPAYNEAHRLPATLKAIAELSAPHILGQCEIIVVDDGSTDSTADVARAFRAPHCRVCVLSLSHRGKGFAIRHGVSFSHGEIVILCDADLQDSISEVLCLVKALSHGADIAIGSRWLYPLNSHGAQPLYRRVSSRIFNLVAGHILALPFKDTQCGLKALTRDAATRAFPLLNLEGWGYDTELIHVALALHLRVEEIDLRLVHDYRDSHFRPIVDGCATFLELFKIRWNDFRGVYRRPVLGPMSPREVLASPPKSAPPTQMPAQECAAREVSERDLEALKERTGLSTSLERIAPEGEAKAA